MLKEINKAVEVFHRIAFKTSHAKRLINEGQLRMFISILTDLLKTRYESFWFPDEPDRASGYRCIRVNGQCFDPVIAQSLEKAGIEQRKHYEVICNEVTVWVDPGVVSFRIGEDGSIGHEVIDEELYAKNMATRGISPKPKKDSVSESDVDSGIGSRSPSPPDSLSIGFPPCESTPTHPRQANHHRTPSPQAYNPYTMSAQICNVARGSMSLHQQTLTPTRQQGTMSPPNMNYSSPSNSAQSLSCPAIPQSLMMPPPTSIGHIPVSTPSFPAARRNVFAESNGMLGHHDNLAAMAAMSMNYQGNPQSYMDIPVVA